VIFKVGWLAWWLAGWLVGWLVGFARSLVRTLLFRKGGRHSREVWMGVCRRGLQTLLKTKSVHFATLFKTKYLFHEQKEIISDRDYFFIKDITE